MNNINLQLPSLPPLWAILPSEKSSITTRYLSYLKREYVGSKEAVGLQPNQAALFDIPLSEIPKTFSMHGNIAVLPVSGVITPRADIWSLIFGGEANIDLMTRDFNTLIEDDNVAGILLDMDTPGGMIAGVLEFAALIFESRDIKPMVAFSSTMAASAGAVIGAATEKMFISSESVLTGSLAVVQTHVNISGFNKMIGIEETEITSGKFKRIASSLGPLTEEGRAVLQAEVDHIDAAIMIDIAKFRNTSVANVNENMAQGKTFVGSKGIDAGLIDSMKTFNQVLEHINSIVEAQSNASVRNNSHNLNGRTSMAEDKTVMTPEHLKANNPDVYNKVVAIGEESTQATHAKELIEANDAGALKERNRITGISGLFSDGNDAIIKAAIEDGVSTKEETAYKINEASAAKRAAMKASLKDESETAVGSGDHEDEAQAALALEAKKKADLEAKEKSKGFGALCDDYQAEKKCSKGEAIQAIAKSHPKEHKAYING